MQQAARPRSSSSNRPLMPHEGCPYSPAVDPTEPRRPVVPAKAWKADAVKAVVWYASWQMECCGDPFAVGDDVAWTADEDVDDEWFTAALGPGMAASITHSEEHHSDEEHLATVEGRVISITGAWCAFGPVEPGDRVHVPIEGSAQFVELEEARAVHRETFPGLIFNGWVVELG